ncbi:hypothetical protein [Butyrivibrio sp. YAB3001]|uniref:hypothetical protein n=1 Tax=Butyrivibrio sp. YAB3001 TaxID=1520812 RepID=UPI0008F618FB|nr:hypothetical protein [Butyrivibrio sp. YAB3001]SFD09693.1 hypothetical protein SAMN02910398_04040 [Butyrivibrio sp. YAB3001]
MGGKVLELPEIKIYAEGKKEGIAEGIAEGKKEGIAEGKKEGKAEERESGIEIFVRDKFEDHFSPETIIAKLQKNYNLSNDDAKEYVKKYSPVAADK